MLILGIDPGLATTGYGLIQAGAQSQYQCIEFGIISTPADQADADRLKTLHTELTALIKRHQPQTSAVEKQIGRAHV